MENNSLNRPWFRVWIATYDDWRPLGWNQSPPRAVALEPVADALYSAEEAALFLEGFNTAMLECDRRIWAVAVPITVRYDGDALAGGPVEGYVFPLALGMATAGPLRGDSASADPSVSTGAEPAPMPGDHFHGFGQSPQRSR